MRVHFRKRGHGILAPGFLDQVKEVLEGKHPDLEVHQCYCGELMLLSSTRAVSLKKEYQTNDIPCKVCRGAEAEEVSFVFLKRFEEITKFLDERTFFIKRSEQAMKREDTEKLGKMAQGLFPTSTSAEMLVGYYDFMQIFFSHFSKVRPKIKSAVRKLFEDVRKINALEFDRLYSSLCDHEKFHKAAMNIYGKQDALSVLKAINSTKSFKDDLVEHEKIDVEKTKIQLELTTYLDSVEAEFYLDLLLNLQNIVSGKTILEAPFKGLALPPLKVKDQPRKIRGLSEKVEYLQLILPFNIKSLYNTHLRNAIAHNEYEICVEEKIIRLTKYSETLSFNDFHRIYFALANLHDSINQYLAEYQIAILRLEVINQGIAAGILGFTDYFEDNGKLHPKAPCDAQLNIYQYWDFTTFHNGERLFPKFDLQIEEKDKSLRLDFGKNGALYVFPEDSQLVEWLEQLILTDRIFVVLHTIAPILPFFARKAITRLPVGKMDVYITDFVSKMMPVPTKLKSSALKFLKSE
jgi:hypothetical protein